MTRKKIEQRVNKILVNKLFVSRNCIESNADLVNDLNLDSLDRTELHFWLNRYFGIEATEDMSKIETVNDIYNFVEEKAKNE